MGDFKNIIKYDILSFHNLLYVIIYRKMRM